MPPARRSDALRNDARILQAAATVLAEDPRAPIQRVADAAGVARLTVYRRYPDREALRRAIFETAAAEASAAMDEHGGDADVDVVTRLRAVVVEMAAIAARYPLLLVGTDLQPLPTDSRRPRTPPASRAMQRGFVALVRRGQEAGELRSDLPAELFPQAVAGTLRIALRFARSLHADPAMLGQQVADLLLTGFAAPAPKRPT